MFCRQGSYYTIRVGEHNRNVPEGPEEDIPGKRVIRHPSYNSPSAINNDIALIQLERPAKLNARVGTVCLPSHGENVPLSAKCFITGMEKKASFRIAYIHHAQNSIICLAVIVPYFLQNI